MPVATTFADWLSTEADRLQQYYVTSRQRQLTCYTLKPKCEAVTGYFTVRIATAVLTEGSDYFFGGNVALCLIVEISEDAQPEDSCQLVQDCLLLNGKQLDSELHSFVETPP